MAQSHTPIFSDPPAAVAALYIPPASAEHLLIAVRSLERVGIPVVAGGPSGESILQFRDIGCECMVANDPADLINQVWLLDRVPVLAVGDAVYFPTTSSTTPCSSCTTTCESPRSRSSVMTRRI